MRQPGPSLQPMSLGTVGAVVGVCLGVGVFLVPDTGDSIEQLARDGFVERAIGALEEVAESERRNDPAHFAWLDVHLRRRALKGGASAEWTSLIEDACRSFGRFAGDDRFRDEIAALIAMSGDVRQTVRAAQNASGGWPESERRWLAEELTRQALSAAMPELAAAIYQHFWDTAQPSPADAIRLAGLWRGAGRPETAATVLNQTRELGGARPDLQRLRLDLARELGRAEEAFFIAREMAANTGDALPPETISLLVSAALEAGRPVEGLETLLGSNRANRESEPFWRSVSDLALAGGRLELAAEALQRLSVLNPEDGALRYRLAQVLEWTQRGGEAFGEYKRALESGEARALERLFSLGEGLHFEMDLAKALEGQGGRLREENLLLRTARLEARIARFERAIGLYRDLIELRPADYELHIEFGGLLLALFEYESALEVFERASRLKPNDSRALAARAETCVYLGRFDEAFELLQEIAPQSDDPEVLASYVSLAEALGRFDGVVEGLRRRIALDAGVTPGHYARLAYVLQTTGAPGYLEVLIEGASRFPSDDGLLLSAAYALGDAREFGRAAGMMRGYSRLTEQLETAQAYATWLILDQRPAEAESFLDRCAEPITLSPGVLALRAQLAEERKEFGAAAAIHERLARLQPGERAHRLNQARLLAANGQVNEARRLLEECLSEEESDPQVLKLAAQVCSAAGEPKRAERFQRRYIASEPQELSEAWGFLGDILLTRGDKTNARRAYRRALSTLIAGIEGGAAR